MCKLNRLGRKHCFEGTRKITIRAIMVLYETRSNILIVVSKKVREAEMDEEILTSGAIEEGAEREWRKSFLESRECWYEKRQILMLEMAGEGEKSDICEHSE